MESLDPRRRQFQRRRQFSRHRCHGSIDLGRGNPQPVRGQPLPVEPLGVLNHRRVATRPDIGKNVGDSAIHRLGGFPRLRQQRG